MAVRLESQGELGTRLPGSDHRDPSHALLSCSRYVSIADVMSVAASLIRLVLMTTQAPMSVR
ncbi:hypothetical protein Stsp01_13930 [Streptomyces sp. NBRC 13847]|nr:hypothetical protein Stsp01_13930 [Streptomyces sp. NBRC 13847]